ncbi:MAG: hypothetical protein C0594_00270, partial [Marinilabiliales bacterium]
MKKTTFLKWLFIPCIMFIAGWFNTAFADDYYWIGGSGNWSEFNLHWATTSGGAVMHTEVPGADDDVYFDANSFTGPGEVVTIDVNAYCNNIDWTGVTNTPDLAGSSALYVSGSLTYNPAMTASFTGWLSFVSSQAGNTIDFSTLALSMSSVQFNGEGEWTLLSDIDLSLMGGSFTLTRGTINTNGITISVGSFQSWPGTGFRVMNLGSSVINCQWINIWDGGSLTLNAGTSTINTETNWFDGQNLTYYNVNFEPTWPTTIMIMGSNTFHNLGLSNNNISEVIFPSNATQTVFDMDFSGSCSNLIPVHSDVTGEAAYIKKISGTLQEDYLILQDLNVIGGATFITDHGIDLGNVTNWTINSGTGTTLYWVGGSGNWSDADHWSTSSGGAYP